MTCGDQKERKEKPIRNFVLGGVRQLRYRKLERTKQTDNENGPEKVCVVCGMYNYDDDGWLVRRLKDEGREKTRRKSSM